MKLAFVVDPLDSFKIYKDSTFAMMREAARRGHASVRAGAGGPRVARRHRGRAARAASTLTGEKPRLVPRRGARARCRSRDFDAVLMRKDPPFDMEYVYSTYLLELAESQGARVFNRPRAMRDWNEKMAIARFPQFTPPTLVTRREPLIREFLAEHGDVILKPLDGMGGASVFRAPTGRPQPQRHHRDPHALRPPHHHGAALHPRDPRRRQARAR